MARRSSLLLPTIVAYFPPGRRGASHAAGSPPYPDAALDNGSPPLFGASTQHGSPSSDDAARRSGSPFDFGTARCPGSPQEHGAPRGHGLCLGTLVLLSPLARASCLLLPPRHGSPGSPGAPTSPSSPPVCVAAASIGSLMVRSAPLGVGLKCSSYGDQGGAEKLGCQGSIFHHPICLPKGIGNGGWSCCEHLSFAWENWH